jgi:hypothetical protein
MRILVTYLLRLPTSGLLGSLQASTLKGHFKTGYSSPEL